jgi:hypothetical protein
MNWWAITTISMWITAAIGSAFTKNDGPFGGALFGSIFLGLLYLFVRYMS